MSLSQRVGAAISTGSLGNIKNSLGFSCTLSGDNVCRQKHRRIFLRTGLITPHIGAYHWPGAYAQLKTRYLVGTLPANWGFLRLQLRRIGAEACRNSRVGGTMDDSAQLFKGTCAREHDLETR